MSFSGTTVEQRSKEVEALKSFLTYSLIGSLALHIGVLSSGISNYLTRVPTGEEEPIEVAIVDSPTAEPEKPIAEIPEEIKKEPEIVQKQPIETPPVEKFEQITAVPQKPQPISTPPKAIPIEPKVAVKSAPIPRAVPEVPVKSASSIPQSAPSEDSKASSPGGGGGGGGGSGVGLGSGSGIAVGTSSGTGPGGGTGTGTGGGIGSGTGTGIGSGTGSGIGSGIGSGTGSGIGSGTGSGIGSGTGNRPTVATAPTTPKINSSGNGNGRAACRECNAKYPEAARRRGVEGRVEVAVDTDAQGNVTNVRIARSSGNRDLDEETKRQARDWKLKPAEGGRQGVSIATEYAIKGSRRSRQVQERRIQREAQERERTQQTTAANSTEAAPRRRRRELAPPSRPAISGFSRRLEPQRAESPARNSSSEARTTRTQGTARESLRRIRREQTTTDSSQKPQVTTNRRRRRDNTTQNKLRDSLRRLRQQPQSQPAAPSQQ
ncbi:MAG: TonB family protein [Nostoc sp. EfeVER01]|uniref:energy transducer TonB n=1 Tax=unclassified Nostoc TaxID=2593658 RepID=UPI002AD2D7A2|nr:MULTISPECIES: TonB family protein [unclassified Nostoc]MDZ7946063.1 TonB family protein [Nostoc sp. EfeVER01]MDZ7995032.1 TonB family protein [Nostoc sp. EspVER01]